MCQIAHSHDTSADVSVPTLDELRSAFGLPSDALCDEALSYAHRELEGSIFNHSVRVFLYADWLRQYGDPGIWKSSTSTEELALERALLFVACLFHDAGTIEACNGPARFEVEGANYAATLLRKHGVAEASVQQVWLAIALHTTGGIAEHAGWLPLIVRSAVLLDFSQPKREQMDALAKQSAIERVLPRGLIERVLANAVVRQALAKPEKAPRYCWPGALLQAHLEDPRWDRDNPAF